jgi:benzoyl-CoA reductase/2-hydroxyglutaryl-CoA dehydratase subunit BcrC/BadD/HgdB
MNRDIFNELTSLRDKTLEQMLEGKENGRKIVGYYCTYSPIELALAAGAYITPLCGSARGPLLAADSDLPQNLCPVVRTLYDLAARDKCPFFHLCDIVIAETTCDGKKKIYELLQRIKPVHIMNLPQIQDSPASLELWLNEIRRLRSVLEDKLGVQITYADIRRAIHITNEEARARKDLFDLNQAVPAVISGRDMLAISCNTEFSTDRTATIALMDRFCGEMRLIAAQGYHVGGPGTPRILITGCPMGEDDDKIVKLVEECDGLVVAFENCGGYKTVELRIDEDDLRDPLVLLAEKYLKVPCSVMCPNTGRIELLEQMIQNFHIGGVIDLTWQACHTYNIESYLVADLVKNKLGRSFLHLETNFSESDTEQLRVRIEAFLETIT